MNDIATIKQKYIYKLYTDTPREGVSFFYICNYCYINSYVLFCCLNSVISIIKYNHLLKEETNNAIIDNPLSFLNENNVTHKIVLDFIKNGIEINLSHE